MDSIRWLVLAALPAAAAAGCIRPDWRSVTPSAAAGAPVSPIVLGSGVSHSSDEPHLIIGTPANSANPYLRLFLHGTASRPAEVSCVLDAISEQGAFPTIGLSYLWLNRTDAERNEMCFSAHPGSPFEVAKCLFLAHSNALLGGESEPGVWQYVAAGESIVGRLVALLRHLDAGFPGEGWGAFLNGNGNPEWSRIIVGGHSQGAGHAAFIAQQKQTAAVGLISGPQDECIGCPTDTRLWLDGPWASSTVGAFASAKEDAIDVIQSNWARMAKAGVLASPIVDVGFAMSTPSASANPCLPRAPMVSWVAPLETATSLPRAAHRSTALDSSSPVAATSDLTGDALPLYSTYIWPSLFRTAEACPSAATLTFRFAFRTVNKTLRWAALLAPIAAATAAAAYLFVLRKFFPSIFDAKNSHKYPILSSVAVMLFGSIAALM